MKIAIFTLTRDRLNYTKRTFKALKETAGMDYDHYVLDNGSKDGTRKWLLTQSFAGLIFSPDNKGLWQGINTILTETKFFEGYDLVLKLDNDVEFPHNNWLKDLVDTYKKLGSNWIISPFVEGVCNGAGGAPRLEMCIENGITIGKSAHVGGICLLTSADNYSEMMPNLALASGWDYWFCTHFHGAVGYIEDIHVKHMDSSEGQEKNKPEYYTRKKKESKIVYKGDVNNYES